MYYQLEGYKDTKVIPDLLRMYTHPNHAEARAYAKHLVEKLGYTYTRLLAVDSAETFYPSQVDGTALSSHNGQ